MNRITLYCFEISLIIDLGAPIPSIRSFIDGQVAPGFRPPAIEGFKDMEPAYSRQLSDYSTILLKELSAHLEKGVPND